MSAFQNQQPLNPVSPMVSQHIAEGDKAAAREKDRQESARQANMQDATTRQMTREQIMARQQGFADKQASDERMQRNAQEFASIQSTQDREFQEKIAKQNLLLEQKKQEAIVNAARAEGAERERYEAEADKIQRELIDRGVAHSRAQLEQTKGEHNVADHAGRMANSIKDRAEDLQGIVDASTELANILPSEMNVALEAAFRGQMKNLTGQTKRVIREAIAARGGPPEGDDIGGMLVSLGVNASLFFDKGLNAILDDLDIPYQSLPEQVRAELAGAGSPGSANNRLAERTFAHRVADEFFDLTVQPTNEGTEQATTSDTRRAAFRGLMTQVITGEFDERVLRAELDEIGIDAATFGTFMHEQGKALSQAAYQARAGVEQGENFEAESVIPQTLIDGSKRLKVVGARFKGMTPDDMRYFAQRLVDPDQLFTFSAVDDLVEAGPEFFRVDDSDQYAFEFAGDVRDLIEGRRELEFGELERVEQEAELQRQIDEIRKRGERAASLAGQEAGLIDFEELLRQ